MRPDLSIVALSVCLLASSAGGSAWAQPSPAASSGFQGVLTYHNDNLRTGQNLEETTLTPGNVNSGSFGKLISYPVDGQVYAQPLYVPNVTIPRKGVHNVVYVATEHDSVYAFDADGLVSDPLWHRSFLNAKAGVTTIPAGDTGANLVGPEIGITSTPVIDSASGTIYVVAATKNRAGTYAQRLHALILATGAEKSGGPRLVGSTMRANGASSKAGMLTFSALRHLQRSALLLDHGIIYIAFASHADVDPYHGWVFAYRGLGLGRVGVFNDTPDGTRGGIWEAGNGPAADANGNVFVASGNGTFDADNGGRNYGDSLIKLVRGGLKLSIADYFTPWNQASLEALDLDFGSSGPVLLPDRLSGPAHLAIAGDKAGTVYLLNRDNLGQFNSGGDEKIVQELPTQFSGGLYSNPAYFNDRIYLGPNGGAIVSYALNSSGIDTSNAHFAPQAFGYPGTTPAISANGSSDGIVWAIDSEAFGSNGPAVLYAYNASDMSELYDSSKAGNRDLAGPAVKFTVPTIANGKVYVGTQSELDVYGLL